LQFNIMILSLQTWSSFEQILSSTPLKRRCSLSASQKSPHWHTGFPPESSDTATLLKSS